MPVLAERPDGGAANAVLAGASFNLRWLTLAIVAKGIKPLWMHFLRLLFVGLAARRCTPQSAVTSWAVLKLAAEVLQGFGLFGPTLISRLRQTEPHLIKACHREPKTIPLCSAGL